MPRPVPTARLGSLVPVLAAVLAFSACRAEPPPAASVRCPDGLGPGLYRRSLEHGGRQRSYLLEVPARTGQPRPPLVLIMHGYTSAADEVRTYLASERASPWLRAGYVRAFPQGLAKSWNGGACCGEAARAGVDDVGFLREVARQAAQLTCADERRVYATGMSNGGFMAYRLACEASDVFAAIAPVGAVLGVDPAQCTPARPVPLLAFNGRADRIVPYEGGGDVGSRPFASAADSVKHFARQYGCAGASTVSFRGPATTCARHDDCTSGAEVEACASARGGHCWPGVPRCPFPPVITDVSASARMIAFFGRHRL